MSSVNGISGAGLPQGQGPEKASKVNENPSDGGGFRSAMSSAAGGAASGVAAASGGVVGVVASGVRGILGSSSGGAMPNAQDDQMEKMFEMQKQNQAFNLQYLELQNGLQEDNRQFSTLTNLMKVRHDTAKAAINNMHA